jgi:hypothetical protein
MLRRSFGLPFLAIGALALPLTPTGAALFVHGRLAPPIAVAASPANDIRQIGFAINETQPTLPDH